MGLSEEELDLYKEQFAGGKACPHCGGIHLRACPRVRRIVFKGQEMISEIEFWAHGKWPEDEIVWPEDVFDPGEAIPPAEGAEDGEEAG